VGGPAADQALHGDHGRTQEEPAAHPGRGLTPDQGTLSTLHRKPHQSRGFHVRCGTGGQNRSEHAKRPGPPPGGAGRVAFG
jgi:hypothetical protein